MRLKTFTVLIAANLLHVSCGTNVNGGNKVIATSSPPPQTSTKPPTEIPLAAISPGFGQSPILKGLEDIFDKVTMISKITDNQTAFSMSDGYSYIFDEVNESIQILQSPLSSLQGFTDYLLEEKSGWRLSATSIHSFNLSEPSATGELKLNVIRANFDSTGHSVLHASKDFLIMKSSSDLKTFVRGEQSISAETISGADLPELLKILPEVVAAGFGPDKKFLWASTSKKVYFFDAFDGFFKQIPHVAALNTGLSSSATLQHVSLRFNQDKQVVGRFIFSSGGKFYVSGLTSPEATLTWEIDIRPISEQRCLSCHGESGAGGFSKADQAISWTGVKRDSIIARVFEQKTMPPADTPAALAMTDEERNKIRVWLSGDRQSTPSATTGGQGTAPMMPVNSIPTPGSTWTTVVKPIIESRCVRCHSTYANFETTYTERSRIIPSIENGSMPQTGSPERTAMTQMEKDSVLVYLKSLQ